MRSYEELKSAIEANGFFTSFIQNPAFGVKLICVSEYTLTKGPHGNSFWVSLKGDQWCICTWTPILYLIPKEANTPELCLDCLRHSNKVLTEIPDVLIKKYGLTEVSEEEYDPWAEEA